MKTIRHLFFALTAMITLSAFGCASMHVFRQCDLHIQGKVLGLKPPKVKIYLLIKESSDNQAKAVGKMLVGESRVDGNIDINYGLAVCTTDSRPDLSKDEIWVYKGNNPKVTYKILKSDFHKQDEKWEIDLGRIEVK